MIFQRLADARILWSLFAVCVLLTIGFVVISQVFGVRFLDAMWVPGEVLAYIGVMTETQKLVHSIATLTLDILYPFAYGALLAGLVLRYVPEPNPFLLLPVLLVIPADLIEGIVQVAILNGSIGLVGWKFWLTTTKFLLFFIALAIALFALGRVMLLSVLQRLRD